MNRNEAAFSHATSTELAELRCDRALIGLEDNAASRLRELLDIEGLADDESLELAAAALDVALFSPGDAAAESMPAHVSAACKRRMTALRRPIAPRRSGLSDRSRRPAPAVVSPSRWSPRFGWLVAAALALAWVAFQNRQLLIEPGDPRARLLSAGATSIGLSRTDDPLCRNAHGEMTWHADRQEGRLFITGLAVNDPAHVQYQLWIFDATRDQRYPVDGGVFDMPSEGMTKITIKPAIPVREATLFAVTVEPPGGSVVSDRRIVLSGSLRQTGD
ncbi:MAG: anti-sigma factor [Phycisphaerae bacterium]|nr:anti-sigma factor [Phycisphaerae bacterium]